MEGKDKIRIRLSISPETADRIKILSKKFNVKNDIAVEMAVYGMATFGEKPLEIEQRLDRIENSLAILVSTVTTEDYQ